MQDISIGGGGRLFNGGGGDRRLRPHQHHQALKCPRCDSVNTKFCYYNNYNLSQPRHFCKSCRRYWTKDGVLRNVPVGGGCRKTKRSKPRQSASRIDTTTSTAATTTPPPTKEKQQQQQRPRKSSNSYSSSESSSLTATNTTATALEVVPANSSSSASNNMLNGVSESKLFAHAKANPCFEPGLLEQGLDCGIFSEIGIFTSLINPLNDNMTFGFSNIMSQHSVEHAQQNHNQQWQQLPHQKMVGLNGEMAGGLIGQTVQVELSALQNRSANEGFGMLDWQSAGDHGLFDPPNAVDQAYWNQGYQWSDQDQPSLHLP